MDIISHIKAFLFSIIPLILHFSSNANQRQPPPEGITTRRPNPPSPPADHDIETGPAEHNPQPASPVVVAGHQNLDYWTKVILAFCFASAIDIAILSVQIHLEVPPTFHLLSLVISFAFASLFVSKFIAAKYPSPALVLNQMAVFFAATAFFMAVTIPSPTSLKCTIWTVYALSLLAVVLCNCS
ncbi:hypothetical protein L1049_028389 [Liquidambar formosana]|uniref:Uncharacterized protein n=1 Tax=Liquidambar formosana TaxID=63359 RepID=A0AAP0RKU4_LIQFO